MSNPIKKPPSPLGSSGTLQNLAPIPSRTQFMKPRPPSLEPSPKIPKIEENELSADSSGDETLQLVGRTPANGSTSDLYVELEAGGGEETAEPDDDADLIAGIEDDFENADRDELIRARIAAHQEQMKSILNALTPEQIQRYEAYRRSGLSRPTIKKVVQKVLEGLVAVLPGKDKPPSINILPSTIIAVGGIAKVFVGEVVEEARAVLEDWGDVPSSAISPAHVLEAQRRLKEKKTIPSPINYKKRLDL